MSNILKWTQAADDIYQKLKAEAEKSLKTRSAQGKTKSSKKEGLFRQVHKTLNLLRENPKHPGLQTHEYTSIESPYDNKQKVFEAYAQNKTPSAYRVFWCCGPGKNEITIIVITPHP